MKLPAAAALDTARAASPTRARYLVVAFGMSLSAITFLDRAAIGQAAPFITRDLHLTSVQMGYVFSAFGLAYALLEIPTGMYCDRKGPRRVLTRIVMWWSVFTIATGWAWSFASLWGTRFLFGAGEAGCYPSLARMFRTWLPQRERAVAEGLKAFSSRMGGAVAPFLVVTLYAFMSWRSVFLVFGAIGFLWAAVFVFWFRDRPSEHPSVNALERALVPEDVPADAGTGGHSSAPWGRYLATPSLWLLCLQWFCHFYAFYFYLTWLPTYLQQVRHVDLKESALLAGLPVLTAAFGSLSGGWLAAVAGRRLSSLRKSRKLLAYCSYAGAALLMLVAIRAASAEAAVFLMGLSSFAAELSGPISWTTAMDLGGAHTGAVSGSMNSIGQLGAAVAPAVVGYLARGGAQGWTDALYSAAAVYVVAFLCWLFLDPVTPLGGQASSPQLG
jgi:MFS transporter, ACS family, glucarate transporter